MDTRVQMLRTNNNTNGMCEAGGSNYIYGHMTEASPEGCGCAEKDCVGMKPIADPPSDERKMLDDRNFRPQANDLRASEL